MISEEEKEANRRAAKARREKRVSSKVVKRRHLIDANQMLLKKMRVEERDRTRGAPGSIPRLPKAEALADLAEIEVGTWIEAAKVRRLVDYGAWVDIGAAKDAFLHVKEIKDGFVRHPTDELTPGQDIRVCITRIDAGDRQSINLSCLGVGESVTAEAGRLVRADGPLALPAALDEVDEGAEVWGSVAKVTQFGAFVDVGVRNLQGFLHVSDYPPRLLGEWAPELFHRGQRLRLYVKEVDLDFNRLKLTAFRPKDRPQLPV